MKSGLGCKKMQKGDKDGRSEDEEGDGVSDWDLVP